MKLTTRERDELRLLLYTAIFMCGLVVINFVARQWFPRAYSAVLPVGFLGWMIVLVVLGRRFNRRHPPT